MRYIRRYSIFILAIVLAAALNYGLNENDRAQFDWLLRPISFLLQLKDGLPYRLTPEGYLSADQSILITPACAGLRFLGLALMGGALLIRSGGLRSRIERFILLLVAAYVLTVLASTSRIWIIQSIFNLSLSLPQDSGLFSFMNQTAGDTFPLRESPVPHIGGNALTPPHNLIGFLVYLFFYISGARLWVLFLKKYRIYRRALLTGNRKSKRIADRSDNPESHHKTISVRSESDCIDT